MQDSLGLIMKKKQEIYRFEFVGRNTESFRGKGSARDGEIGAFGACATCHWSVRNSFDGKGQQIRLISFRRMNSQRVGYLQKQLAVQYEFDIHVISMMQ